VSPDKNNLPEAETEFLILCLRSRWQPATLAAAQALAAAPGWNWDTTAQRVATEGIAPLLAHTLRGAQWVPAELRSAWRTAYLRNGMRNALLFQNLATVLDGLARTRIPVIVLKGAALAETIYGNVALRPMVDLDLLVRPAQAQAALAVLQELGYATADIEERAGVTLNYENEVALVKPGVVPAAMELHWSLFDSPFYQQRLNLDWFWASARPATIAGRPAQVLGLEAQLLHLSAHVVLHHQGAGMLWLHDIAELLARQADRVDWNQLLVQAQENDLVLPLQQVLQEVTVAWQVSIPHAASARLAALEPRAEERRVYSWLTAEQRPVVQRFWADLASLPGWRQRLDFAWRNLFPAPAYMVQRYGIRRRWLTAAYYPYRWWTGAVQWLTARRRR
jgi:hypothetical protein